MQKSGDGRFFFKSIIILLNEATGLKDWIASLYFPCPHAPSKAIKQTCFLNAYNLVFSFEVWTPNILLFEKLTIVSYMYSTCNTIFIVHKPRNSSPDIGNNACIINAPCILIAATPTLQRHILHCLQHIQTTKSYSWYVKIKSIQVLENEIK